MAQKEGVRRDWRRLHNEELYDLYPSSHTIQVIQSRKVRWVGHIARMGNRRGAYSVLVGKREIEEDNWKK